MTALFRGSATALLLLSAAACGKPSPFSAAAAVQGAADAPDPGYRAAPQISGLTLAADGTASLGGRAAPSAKVSLASPAGLDIETTADGSGAWSASLGSVTEPTLYRLASDAGGHKVEAEGYVAVLPGWPTAALLRAGAGADVRDAGKAELAILAVDLDAGGAAVVSGRAKPASPVRVRVDGVLAVEGAAGQDGRFSLTLPKPLDAGPRRIQAMTPQAAAQADIVVGPPRLAADAPYQATAGPSGWRLDWLTPGGGPQTTLLISAPVPG